MKIKIIHVSKRFSLPLWAVLIILFWLCLGCLVILLSAHLSHPVELCLFKRLTGLPCPTCGFTRGAFSILGGHIIQAWLYNPFLYSVLALFFAATSVRLLFAQTVRIHLTPMERAATWVLAIMLFCANWVYVIFYVG